jgi:signal transduction histidine kinase/CheY-like chemotaxis protein
VDITRRRGWQRDWHFWAMLALDTLLMGANALAAGRLAYLSIPFFIVVALGHSLGLPRAARVQLLLACIVYPLACTGGLWLEHTRLTMADAGRIAMETICLGGLGWLAITGPIRFTDRLRRARHALDVLSTGVFDTRLPTGALDDIGFLAVSFNRAAEALAEAEGLLATREAELRQLHRIEAIGQLAGGVAHDFNNHLTVVLANLELASTEIPSSSPAHADIQEAARATRNAAELTQQLLAFGRKQILKPETIDVRAAVRELAPMIGRLVGANVRVATELAPAPCFASADASQLAQVLLNLATNARDAMGTTGGTLTIAVGAEEDHVVLRVRDTGAGMDAATAARIFEPFFTTKGVGMGNGLGLATVHGIVAQSGGTVAVESAPGRGTTFTIRLPAVSAPVATSQRAKLGEIITPSRSFPQLERSVDRNAGVVLLVEDEPTVRISTRRILERAGYQVVEAADGLDALKRFASRESGAEGEGGPPVQILVTDLMMPNLGGAELAARLRMTRPDLPVILLSGYSEDAVLAEGAPLPGAVFIGKPPQRHELVAAMAELLRREPARAVVNG